MITKKQREALDILQEECAEVIKAASKIKRWGPDSNNRGQNPLTNMEELIAEIGDTIAMIDLVKDLFGINDIDVESARTVKLEKLKHYSKLFE